MTWAAAGWVRWASLAALAPMVLLCVWIWFGLSRPSPVLVLEGYQMVLLAPAWAILVVALMGRHWIVAAVALAVAVMHLNFSVPAATADAEPTWVEESSSFSLYALNALYQNDSLPDVADHILGHDADVVVINEMTDALYAELESRGAFERYPTVEYVKDRLFGELLMTRLDVAESGIASLGGLNSPYARIRVGEGTASVYAVHVHAPKNQADRHVWRRHLDGIGTAVERLEHPAIFAGDFNATLWHGPFRRMLARGLRDGHDQQGEGLRRSWTSPVPVLRWLGPIMGLDHVLVNDGAFVTSIRNERAPGSDHQGLISTVAVRPPSPG